MSDDIKELVKKLRAQGKKNYGLYAEVADALEALLEERDRLKAAMVEVEDRLNCRGSRDIAHYCPNCDNSLYKTREIAREALEANE